MRIFDKNELPLKKALAKAKKLIGSDMVKKFYRSIQFTDEPRLFQYATEVGNYSKYSDAPFAKDFGSGLSLDEKVAQMRALGEAIERFCLSLFRKKDFKKSSFYDIERKAIDPVRFLNLSKSQIKTSMAELEERVRKYPFFWTDIFSLQDRKDLYIPAHLTYVPISLDRVTLRHPISTGAALGTSYSGAIYRGICEVIERDAFMINYLAKIPAPEVDISSVNSRKIKEVVKYFERYFLDVHIFGITTDIKMPTMLAVIIDSSGVGPEVSIGCNTDLGTEEAIIGSIEEAQKVRVWIRYNMISNKKRFRKLKNNPKEIKEMEDRGMFWGHKNMAKNLGFLLNSGNRVKVRMAKAPRGSVARAKKAIKMLRDAGLDVYVKDMTPKRPSVSTFKVVKVVVPEAQPLYLYEDLKYFGGKRLYEVPYKLGYKKSRRFRPNKFPHPFV